MNENNINQWKEIGVDLVNLGFDPRLIESPIKTKDGFYIIYAKTDKGANVKLQKKPSRDLCILVIFEKSKKKAIFKISEMDMEGFANTKEAIDRVASIGFCKLRQESLKKKAA